MKQRASRNQTIVLTDDERKAYSENMASTLERNLISNVIVNEIINNDFFAIHQSLPHEFVDLLIIDPPYNMDKNFGSNEFKKLPSAKYEQYVESFIIKCKPLLKQTASIYVCCDWQSSTSIYNVLSRHFIIRNRITWEREKGRGALTNWKNAHEDIWYCTVSDDFTFNVENVKLKRKVLAPYRSKDGAPKDWSETEDGNYRLTYPSNLWSDITIPFWSMPENTDHPTQKPEKLIAKLILASSKPNDMVFDPFAGSGTTLAVARKLDREFLGVEIDKEWCLLAKKRIHMAFRNKSIQGYKDRVFWERNSK